MNPPGLGLSALFDRAPAEAIAYLQQKQVLPSLDWWEVLDGAHAQAFAVAHLARLDLLEDIRQSLVAALQKGTTFAQWSAQLEPYLQAKGWWGKQVFVDGQGNAKVATVGSPHRMETIYRTNLQSAYMAGRRAQMLEAVDTHPYWRYVAVMDARTRPSHRALHGRVMAADDPAWDSIFPPCGFNCRCRVAPMTPQGVERGGYAVESSAGHMRTEVVGVGPGTTSTTITRLQLPSMDQAFKTDPGFNHAPGQFTAVIAKITEKTDMAKLKAAKTLKTVGNATTWPTFAPVSLRPDEWVKLGAPILEELLAHTIDDKPVAQWLAMEWRDYERAHLKVAEYLQSQLQARRNAGATKSNVKGRGKGAQVIKRAASRYPESWVQSANALGELNAIYSQKRGWAYTAESSGPLRLNGKVYNAKAGEGWITTSDSSTAEHEYAHRIQSARPDLDKIFQDEHLSRTHSESLQSLRSLTGLNFGQHELAKPDGYYNPYQGREYVNQGGALEVMTMALQPLLGHDTKAGVMLHEMFEKDRRMIELTLGLLFHAD